MHRRNSKKPNPLSRRKSTSSVKSVHLEHIHPATAERDAQAAAAQAFARAQGRSATDAMLWPPSRSEESNKSTSHDNPQAKHGNDPALHRQQSIRFVPIPTRTSRSTQSHTMNDGVDIDIINSTSRTGTTRKGEGARPKSRASALGMVSAAKGMAGDYISPLFTGDEHYTPEDDIASAPSSYRKLRKSRSMNTGSSGASITSRNYLPASATSIPANRVPPPSSGSSTLEVDENIPPAGLRAPKSMSFLRSRRDHSTLFSQHHGSISKYQPGDEGSRSSNSRNGLLKSQPSTFLRPRIMGTDKFMRKSMRDASNESEPVDEKTSKDGSLRIRARKVSSNFKHKLKNFFSLTKGDSDEASFPPQQIEASKSHNTDLDHSEYINEDRFPFHSAYDEAAISRVPSGVPSLHDVPSHQQLRSRQGSFESLDSERRVSNERSRVTSWSDSDTNTINTTSRKGEWERKRLSIINEDGAHIPSTSKPIKAGIYNMDSKTSLHLPPTIPSQPAPADSQRIYSALMKNLDSTNHHSQRNEVQRQRSVDDFLSSGVVPPRGSSRVWEGGRGADTPPTIRRVPPSSLSELTTAKSAGKKPATRAAKVGMELNESLSYSMNHSPQRQGIPSSASAPIAYEAGRVQDSSDQLLAVPRIQSPSPRPLSTRSSAFFASPTCHLFRTQSPYRRAIQDSMKQESHDSQDQQESESSQLKSPEFNPWMRSLTSLPMRRPSTCESEMDKKMHYAESIYSSTTEDPVTNTLNHASATASKFPAATTTHGDATIFVDPPVYRPTPPPVPKHRVVSTASSVEWKTWLSANVSKLEGSPNHGDTGVLEYAVPSSRSPGHVREDAQIHDDDDDESPLEVYKPTRANNALTPIEQNTRAQGPRLASSGTPPGIFYDRANEEVDPLGIQSKSKLYSTPSLGSVGSIQEAYTEPTKKGVFDSLRRKSLAHKSSLHTLSGNPTSRKLVKKRPGLESYVIPKSSSRLAEGADKHPINFGGHADSKGKLGTAMSTKTENVSPKTGVDGDVDPYDAHGSGVFGPGCESSPQAMGSRKMVDLFLSSRRKRMASGEEGGAFI